MKPRWINGDHLLAQINKKELLEAVKSGRLTPYDPDDCKQIIDYEMLLIKKKEGEGITTWRMPTEKELLEAEKSDRKPGFINIDNITSFRYSAEQLEAFWLTFKEALPTHINSRKAVAYEAARGIKKLNPTIETKQAAIEVNKYLKENKFSQYDVKHLMKLITPLGFQPGKPGRKPKI